MRRRFGDWWNHHWFEAEDARNLAVARILAATVALWVLLSQDRAGVSALPSEFWSGVAVSTRWRYLLFPGNESLERLLTWLLVALLLGALLGVRPRLCAFGSALLLYHLAPLESIIWTPSPEARGLTLATLTLLLCGIAPSGDALAIGRLGTGDAAGAKRSSWRYGWPLRLIQLSLVSVYFFSGIAKLRSDGLAWGSAENISHWLRFMTQNDLTAKYHSLGGWMADHALVAGAIGVGTLVFEVSSPAALFMRRLRPWFALIAILFHAGIYFAMNITLNSWPLLLIFVDWGALGARRRRRKAAAQSCR